MVYPDAIGTCRSILRDTDIYGPRRNMIWRAMCRLDDRGEPVDIITLEQELRKSGELEAVGGIEGLVVLDRFATAHNVAAHCEILRGRGRIRDLVIVASEIAEEGRGDLEDESEFIDSAERRLLDVFAGSQRGGPEHVGKRMAAVIQAITDRQRAGSTVTGVETPWPKISEMTAGLQSDDLIILAARPSMGKTAFALNLAAHAAVSSRMEVVLIKEHAALSGCKSWDAYLELVRRGPEDGGIRARVPTLVFSMEMSADQLIERVLCTEARVDAAAVRVGSRLMDADFRGLIGAAERVAMFSDLFIDDRAAQSIAEIRSKARTWANRHAPLLDPSDKKSKRLGMILVDYLQLAKGTKKGQSREQEINEISQGLKALAKELRVPVLALAQLNRQVDLRADHRPVMADLRESGAIEQDADVIMFIYREERYLPNDATEEQRVAVEGRAEVIIGKQRNGPVGTVHLHFVKKHTAFENPIEAEF